MGKGKRGPIMLKFVELKAKDYEYESSSPNLSQKYSSHQTPIHLKYTK